MTAAIQAVFHRNRDQLAGRVGTLEDAIAALLAGDLGHAQQIEARRDAHKLAGSLGMFGLPRGSELALELEHAFQQAHGPSPEDYPHLSGLVEELRAVLDQPPGEPVRERSTDATAPESRGLLLVSSDPALTERLHVEALARNLRPRSATSSSAARRLAASETPLAAVLDVSFAAGVGDDLQLIEELAGREPQVPVLVLTGSEALVDRVEVARRGGRGFLQRTRPAAQVVDAISEQIKLQSAAEATILAVDDDAAVSAALVALLASSGLSVQTLNEPLRFWEVLEEVAPDLLVLDLDMPGLNGIDLCRAVRADVRFGQLPIVFLTARADPRSVQGIFEAGADDYVAKPIVGPELVTRVLNRLERIRLFRDLADRDGLTGVASRRKSSSALEAFAMMSVRFGQPLSVALLDLDRFKALNDRLGHAAGDAALRRIGETLVENFRGEDVIGRWGGEEFIVGMYGMTRQDGVQRIEEVLERFRLERFAGRDGARAELTFSAGVAEFPCDGDDLESLVRAADGALYRAKAEGRGRVCVATPA